MTTTKIVSMLVLDLDVDPELVEATHSYWKEHVQPRLGPDYELGVAGRATTLMTPNLDAFKRAMQTCIEGVSYKNDAEHFAEDRAERVLQSLQDPNVAAMWVYNGGALSSKVRDNTKQAMLSIVKGLQVKLTDFKARAFISAQNGHINGTRDFAARLPQKKPILGYCYGAAVMSILGILDVCRPVHAPLGMDLSLYAEEEEYPPDLLKAQLQCLTGAIKGTLTSVSFPPGLELQNEAAARFAQGQLQCEGFVLVALLQIIYSVLGKLIPHGTKVILVPELLDFGDEVQLLGKIAELHQKGVVQVQAVLWGYECVRVETRHDELYDARLEFMQRCPGVPVITGIPVGHSRPNHVVPMGWARLHCDMSNGHTTITYVQDPTPGGRPGQFQMLGARQNPPQLERVTSAKVEYPTGNTPIPTPAASPATPAAKPAAHATGEAPHVKRLSDTHLLGSQNELEAALRAAQTPPAARRKDVEPAKPAAQAPSQLPFGGASSANPPHPNSQPQYQPRPPPQHAPNPTSDAAPWPGVPPLGMRRGSVDRAAGPTAVPQPPTGLPRPAGIAPPNGSNPRMSPMERPRSGSGSGPAIPHLVSPGSGRVSPGPPRVSPTAPVPGSGRKDSPAVTNPYDNPLPAPAAPTYVATGPTPNYGPAPTDSLNAAPTYTAAPARALSPAPAAARYLWPGAVPSAAGGAAHAAPTYTNAPRFLASPVTFPSSRPLSAMPARTWNQAPYPVAAGRPDARSKSPSPYAYTMPSASYTPYATTHQPPGVPAYRLPGAAPSYQAPAPLSYQPPPAPAHNPRALASPSARPYHVAYQAPAATPAYGAGVAPFYRPPQRGPQSVNPLAGYSQRVAGYMGHTPYQQGPTYTF